MELELAFNWVIKSSFMASILAVLILLVKYALRNKLNAKWQYTIWMLLIIRLLIPFNIQGYWSIYSLLSDNLVKNAIVTQLRMLDINTQINNMSGKDLRLTIDKSINKQSNTKSEEPISKDLSYGRILAIIWLVGVLVLAILTIAINLRFYLKVRREPSVTDARMSKLMQECTRKLGIRINLPIIITNRIEAPCLYGIFSPKLLLSQSLVNRLNEENIRHIFMHELSHYKRKDILINWLAVAAQIAHWFNPLIWYSFAKMREDCELACDANTLSFLRPEEYQSYGLSIISLVTPAQAPWLHGTTGFFGNKNNHQIKRRIKMIKFFQKPTLKWTCTAVVVFISLGLVGFTDSISNATPEAGVNTSKQTSQLDQSSAAIDFQIPQFGNPGSILSVDSNSTLQTVDPGLTGRSSAGSTQNQSSGIHMPKMEPGMRIVYDGAGDLMKITSADSSIYYFPTHANNEPKYQNGTFFIYDDPEKDADGNGTSFFNIDTPEGLLRARAWIEQHPKIKNQKALETSLNLQRGTKALIYYMWKV